MKGAKHLFGRSVVIIVDLLSDHDRASAGYQLILDFNLNILVIGQWHRRCCMGLCVICNGKQGWAPIRTAVYHHA